MRECLLDRIGRGGRQESVQIIGEDLGREVLLEGQMGEPGGGFLDTPAPVVQRAEVGGRIARVASSSEVISTRTLPVGVTSRIRRTREGVRANA